MSSTSRNRRAMRDPGVSPIDLARAAIVTGATPTFRFHGNRAPVAGQRIPILNGPPAAAVDEAGTVVLRLYDPIDSWGGDWGVSAKEFASVLDSLPGDVQRVQLRINSPGGEVFDALAIMNLLRAYDANVTAVVDGIAASAASFIAASADETIMSRNAEMMIHDAMGIALGNAGELHKMADILDHISANIAGVYADKSGGTVKAWRTAMLDETWYNADEAVKAGLADTVDVAPVAGDTDPVDAPAPDAPSTDAAPEDRFDLAALFEHAGRKDAPAPPVPSNRDASETDDDRHERGRRHRYNARRLGLPA